MKAMFDGIKNIGNLGNILRHAFIFDTKEILLTENQAIFALSKLHKSSAGYVNKQKLVYLDDFQKYLKNYKGRKICPVPDKKAKNLFNFKFKENDLLIFGDERGVPDMIKKYADEFLYIPMSNKFPMMCLNLATAFSIIAFEQFKQKKSIRRWFWWM